MNKRAFLKSILAGGALALLAPGLYRKLGGRFVPTPADVTVSPSDIPASGSEAILEAAELENVVLEETVMVEDGFQHMERGADLERLTAELSEEKVDDYLNKIRNFDADFATDIYLSVEKQPLLVSTLARLERVQAYVGHGNFNLIAFDEMLFFARNYDIIGAFTKPELDFLEEIFFADAHQYGFFGEKVTPELTTRIPLRDVVKVPGSGHYLRKGESYNLYLQIHRDVGDNLLLTSGLRNVVKQMHLFLDKTHRSGFNLSKASRSLAPPGHSFHCIGDFDVGKIGLGALNFTQDFSRTEVFRRMVNLGYIDIRYPDDNLFGVRYEPWHVKLG